MVNSRRWRIARILTGGLRHRGAKQRGRIYFSSCRRLEDRPTDLRAGGPLDGLAHDHAMHPQLFVARGYADLIGGIRSFQYSVAGS